MTPRFMEASGPTDPMALLMRQRIVFLGTQARADAPPRARHARCACMRGGTRARATPAGRPAVCNVPTLKALLFALAECCHAAAAACTQVDDFTADAVISQLLYLDAQDPTKARCLASAHALVTLSSARAVTLSR
jgi:hypothetical protein